MTMPVVVIVILLLLLFAFGGGYWGYRTWGAGGGLGIFGFVLVFLLVLWALGILRVH